jgi:hypothetical protein
MPAPDVDVLAEGGLRLDAVIVRARRDRDRELAIVPVRTSVRGGSLAKIKPIFERSVLAVPWSCNAPGTRATSPSGFALAFPGRKTGASAPTAQFTSI